MFFFIPPSSKKPYNFLLVPQYLFLSRKPERKGKEGKEEEKNQPQKHNLCLGFASPIWMVFGKNTILHFITNRRVCLSEDVKLGITKRLTPVVTVVLNLFPVRYRHASNGRVQR